MKITEKGQVTIPQDLREKLGLLPFTEVEFVLQRGGVLLRKAKNGRRRGKRIVDHLRGRGTSGLSTEEIMAHTRAEGDA
jgi:AbrB family looped-hinge helix DNA binding protein